MRVFTKNDISNNFKIIAILFAINIIIYTFFGSYLEEYEGMLSSFVHGTYTHYAVREWNIDAHFLLFGLYSYINQFFPNLQIYAIILFLYNLFALTAFGLTLYHIINIRAFKYPFLFFCILYCIIAVDYILNLGSTRIAFLMTVSLIAYVELKRLQAVKISRTKWILLIVLLCYFCLIKVEIILLTFIVYIFLLILHKRFYYQVLLLLTVVLLVMFLYNIIISNYLNEARQVFYYKEFDFFDKNNIYYEHLTKLQYLNVEAFKKYLILDKEHFTMSFYNSIALPQGIGTMLSIVSLFFDSLGSYLNSLPYLIFALISGLILVLNNKNRKLWFMQVAFCFLFPFTLSIVIIVPERVLIPYYSIIGIVNILIICNCEKSFKYAIFLSAITCFFSIKYDIRTKFENEKIAQAAQTSVNKISLLNLKYKLDKPLIVNTIEYRGRFFPIKPFYKNNRQNAIFLNFFFFNSYNCYLDAWKEVCNCNPLSLSEKVDFIISSGSLFVISDEAFIFLQKYFLQKYNKKIIRIHIDDFDKDLKVCRLLYGI